MPPWVGASTCSTTSHGTHGRAVAAPACASLMRQPGMPARLADIPDVGGEDQEEGSVSPFMAVRRRVLVASAPGAEPKG